MREVEKVPLERLYAFAVKQAHEAIPSKKLMHPDMLADCFHCGRMTYHPMTPEGSDNPKAQRTRDHVVPKCSGGTLTVIACRECNETRGHAPLEVFHAFLRLDPPAENRQVVFREFQNMMMLRCLSLPYRSKYW